MSVKRSNLAPSRAKTIRLSNRNSKCENYALLSNKLTCHKLTEAVMMKKLGSCIFKLSLAAIPLALLVSNAHAAKMDACFVNKTGVLWYGSVRWTNGNSNFTLPNGQSHRLNGMDTSDTYVCWAKEPMGNSCPIREPITKFRCS